MPSRMMSFPYVGPHFSHSTICDKWLLSWISYREWHVLVSSPFLSNTYPDLECIYLNWMQFVWILIKPLHKCFYCTDVLKRISESSVNQHGEIKIKILAHTLFTVSAIDLPWSPLHERQKSYRLRHEYMVQYIYQINTTAILHMTTICPSHCLSICLSMSHLYYIALIRLHFSLPPLIQYACYPQFKQPAASNSSAHSTNDWALVMYLSLLTSMLCRGHCSVAISVTVFCFGSLQTHTDGVSYRTALTADSSCEDLYISK